MIKNKFISRLSEPEKDNKYFINVNFEGFNKAKAKDDEGSVLPSDVGWVIGRWMESSNSPKNKLSVRNMFKNNTYYETGSKPMLGAIGYWENEEKSHLGFVEEIKDNGNVIFSNSGSKNKGIYIRELKEPYNYNGLFGKMEFKGFIYPIKKVEKENNKESKTLETLVKEVSDGRWGDGLDRYRKINKAFKNGEILFDYDTIQNELNK